MSQNRIFGIDLGTTYSCIAYVDDAGKPVVIPNAENELTTPSVVAFQSESTVAVGTPAKEALNAGLKNVISMVKRRMGDGDVTYSGPANEPLTPQEVSAHVLRKLVKDARTYLANEPITDVVITCPAYFDLEARAATRQAGELAELRVHYVLPEPTAAAVFYGMEARDDQTVLVYDLGGGTFDVTVIAVSSDGLDVITVDGDDELGGGNWDEDLARALAAKFCNEHGGSVADLMMTTETWRELMGNAERAKRSLSQLESVGVTVIHGATRARIEISRTEFDEITASRLSTTMMLTENVLEKAKEKGRTQIDTILLVGGSTFMPQVRARLAQEFPDAEIVTKDPNQAVAKGAAIFGQKCCLEAEVLLWIAKKLRKEVAELEREEITAHRKEAAREVAILWNIKEDAVTAIINKTIRNVTSQSFGVVVMDNDEKCVSNLIVADEDVPLEVEAKFGTYKAGQSSVQVECMRNTRREKGLVGLDVSEKVGEGVLNLGRSVPVGYEIAMRFELGVDGLLKVRATDVETGKALDMKFVSKAILSEKEVKKRIEQANAMVMR